MSYGMNQHTGKAITGFDEFKQRVQRCIFTRKGTLPGRRDYGSRFPELVDNKLSGVFKLDVYAAADEMFRDAANGLTDFELKNTQVVTNDNYDGVQLYLTGTYLPEQLDTTLEGLVL